MEWSELLRKRVSCRKYDTERPVEREKTLACVEAARLAPSGHNAQRWRFIVVDDPAKRDLVAKGLADPDSPINRFSRNIPVFIVLVKDASSDFKEYASPNLNEARIWDIDIGIAAEHICLEATNQGLGSIMMGYLNEAAVKAALDIPKELEVPLVVGLGYPQTTESKPRPRRAFSEITCLNSYNAALSSQSQ